MAPTLAPEVAKASPSKTTLPVTPGATAAPSKADVKPAAAPAKPVELKAPAVPQSASKTGLVPSRAPSMIPGIFWIADPPPSMLSKAAGDPIHGPEFMQTVDQMTVERVRPEHIPTPTAPATTKPTTLYQVRNTANELVYTATQNDLTTEIVFNCRTHEAFRMKPDIVICGLLCGAGSTKMEVNDPPTGTGRMLARAVQESGCPSPKFRLEDEKGKPIFKLEASSPVFPWSSEVSFKLLEKSGDSELGQLVKRRLDPEGYLSTQCTFKKDIPVLHKASILSACVLIHKLFGREA